MAKDFFSKKVCEQLASELVAEEAKMLKQVGVVKTIRHTIREKKLEVIRERVDRRLFKVKNRMVIVINVSSYETDGGFMVEFSFAEHPDFALGSRKLTKKEQEVFDEYREAFVSYTESHEDTMEYDLSQAAYSLAKLKHGIRLLKYELQTFGFHEACDPDFFEKTGITVGAFRECSAKELMLEDVIIKTYK